MSYSDFISSLGYGFNLIFDNIGSFANTLLSNYIFMTLLGLSLFISLFLFFLSFVLDMIDLKKDKKNDSDEALKKVQK